MEASLEVDPTVAFEVAELANVVQALEPLGLGPIAAQDMMAADALL